MSIFSETGQTNGGNQTEGNQEGQTQTSFLEQLVSAKGDNWRDTEVLAKGKLESDRYIADLENQLKQLREDLSKESYAEKLLQEIRGQATASSNVNTISPNDNTAGTTTEGTPASLSEEDLKSLVNKTLKERDTQAVVANNLKTVEDGLVQKFGTDAKAVVQKKAAELGISLSRLEEIASESPDAFFTLLGEKKPVTNPMVGGSVRTEGVSFQNTGERDWAYYQKLRRENKSLYYTPKIQRQLFDDKARLGDKFGL